MWNRFRYVKIEEINNTLTSVPRALKREILPVHAAYNRVLAEDVISNFMLPPHNISHFDGYAVKSEDTFRASVENPIHLSSKSPNEEDSLKITNGEAIYVSTGSSLADGADAVIPIEMVKDEKGQIEIRRPIKRYQNVTRVGQDIERGETILKTGQTLRAQDIKILMELRKWKVWVFKKPTIAMISTGNELTDQIEEAHIKKFDSHSPMLSILINESGGVPLDLGIAMDEINHLKKMLLTGLEKSDIVVTIGGGSVGREDFVWKAVNSLSPSVKVRGLKIQPGRVTSFYVVNNKCIVMLPGHIQSMLVGFYLILLPLIRIMNGLSPRIHYPTLNALMSRKLVVKSFIPFEKVRFVKVKVTEKSGRYFAEAILGDSSLTSVLVKSNGFLIIPSGKKTLEEGEETVVHLLPGVFPPYQELGSEDSK